MEAGKNSTCTAVSQTDAQQHKGPGSALGGVQALDRSPGLATHQSNLLTGLGSSAHEATAAHPSNVCEEYAEIGT